MSRPDKATLSTWRVEAVIAKRRTNNPQAYRVLALLDEVERIADELADLRVRFGHDTPGAEAEALRKGIERLIGEGVPAYDWVPRLQCLLDDVDAGEALSYLEKLDAARADAERLRAELRTIEWGCGRVTSGELAAIARRALGGET